MNENKLQLNFQTNRGRLVVRYVFLALALLFMALIFYFSSQNGKVSNDVSQDVSDGIGSVIGKPPTSQSPESVGIVSFFLENIRQFAHVFLYAGLGLSVSVCLFTFPFEKPWWTAVLAVAVCFLYACSDELHQAFVPGRNGKFTDVLIDAIGFMITIVLSHAVLFFRKGRKKRLQEKMTEK